jgi:hypothetical protein
MTSVTAIQLIVYAVMIRPRPDADDYAVVNVSIKRPGRQKNEIKYLTTLARQNVPKISYFIDYK